MTDDRTQIVRRDSTVEIGAELNQTYKIDALIGVGGMGEVYKGHNIQTGDPVAIKVVLPEFARDEMIFELFRKEARVLNHLSHDAIVRYYVFSLDRALGRPYLAMEFVDGPSLANRIKTTPLTPPDFFILLRRLADGLHRAHEAGVIHRDISPDNVILPGVLVENAKIIDFGIARSANTGGGTLLGGSFAGKYSYVSPEQLGLYGGEVTPKSDIYSLGLTMAAAIRGTPLDMSGSQVEVIDKRRVVPNLSGIGIPKPVHAILTAMLQPDPAKRPASMAEVRDQIDRDHAALKAKTKAVKPSAEARLEGKASAPQPVLAPGDSGSHAIRNAAWAIGLVSVIGVGALGGWIYVQNQKTAEAPLLAGKPSEAVSATIAKPDEQKTAEPVTSLASSVKPEATSAVLAPEPAPPLLAPSEVHQQADVSTAPQAVSAPAASAEIPATPLPKSSPAVSTIASKLPDQPPTSSVIAQPAEPPAIAKAKPDVAPKLPAAAKFDVAALTKFVSAYGADKCFKADVTSMSENSTRLTALGSEEGRSAFEKDFLLKAGFRPDVSFNSVTQDQCPFVSSLSKLPANATMPLQVKLDRSEIRGSQSGQSAMGDALNVSITGVGDRNVYLYVVDYSGGIQNINRACPNCIKMKSGEMSAALSLTPPEDTSGSAPQSYPVIIFAVAAAKPLLSINDQDAYDSDAFVKPLLDSAKASDNFSAQTAYVTLKSR